MSAFLDSVGNYNSGSVYLYKEINGKLIQQQKLIPENLSNNAYYGLQIIYKNDMLLVSSPGANNYQGVIYIYKLSLEKEWKIDKILKPDSITNDSLFFGLGMSVTNENALLVSEQLDSEFNGSKINKAGVIIRYLYDDYTNKWVPKDSLIPSIPKNNMFFGVNIEVLNNNEYMVSYNNEFIPYPHYPKQKAELLFYSAPSITNLFYHKNIDDKRIYPNPVKDHLFIDLDEPHFIELYDLRGTFLNKISSSNYDGYLDMTELKHGVYIVKIYSKTEEKIFKVLKQ